MNRSNFNLKSFIQLAIDEDIRDGDHSSLASIPEGTQKKAQLLVKESGVLAGVEIAEAVFNYVDEDLVVNTYQNDGDRVKIGDVVLIVTGSAHSILKAERLVLNIMQRMSGIATHTDYIMSLIKGTKAKVLDTRKTTPGFRYFEKLAVKIGGGENHRFGLFDMIMLKDNHIDYAGGIKPAIQKTLSYLKDTGKALKIEVEARGLDEVREILSCEGVDRIMLDNFNYEDTKTAVELINCKCEVESSGGITEDTIRGYALCGVDYISVGALTHTVKSLDLSLKAFE